MFSLSVSPLKCELLESKKSWCLMLLSSLFFDSDWYFDFDKCFLNEHMKMCISWFHTHLAYPKVIQVFFDTAIPINRRGSIKASVLQGIILLWCGIVVISLAVLNWLCIIFQHSKGEKIPVLVSSDFLPIRESSIDSGYLASTKLF